MTGYGAGAFWIEHCNVPCPPRPSYPRPPGSFLFERHMFRLLRMQVLKHVDPLNEGLDKQLRGLPGVRLCQAVAAYPLTEAA